MLNAENFGLCDYVSEMQLDHTWNGSQSYWNILNTFGAWRKECSYGWRVNSVNNHTLYSTPCMSIFEMHSVKKCLGLRHVSDPFKCYLEPEQYCTNESSFSFFSIWYILQYKLRPEECGVLGWDSIWWWEGMELLVECLPDHQWYCLEGSLPQCTG